LRDRRILTDAYYKPQRGVEVKSAGRENSKKYEGVTKVGEVKILLLPPIKGIKNRPFWRNQSDSPTGKWQEVENRSCFEFSDEKIVS
jgi:hypothetical protein